MNFIEDFVETIYSNQDRFLPMIPLGNTVKLGDLLLLRSKWWPGSFDGSDGVEYVGNIADEKIGVAITEGPDEEASDQKWQSHSGMTWSAKAAGTAPKVGSALSEAEAGISIAIGVAKGFVFQPLGIKYKRIENLVTVREQLKKKLTQGLFDCRELWVVKEIAIVGSYALAISLSKQAQLEVSAKAGVQSVSLADLARVDLGLSVKQSQDLGFQEVGASGGSLFFRAEKMVLARELPKETRDLLASTPGLRAGGALLDLPHATLQSPLIQKAVTFRDMTLEDLMPRRSRPN